MRHLVSATIASVKTKNYITTSEVERLNQLARDVITENKDLEKIYNELVEVSLSWESIARGLYEHRAIICLMATKVLVSNKQAIYSQLNPGNGKTFLNLLACYHLSIKQNLKTMYVTLHKGLKRTVEDKME